MQILLSQKLFSYLPLLFIFFTVFIQRCTISAASQLLNQESNDRYQEDLFIKPLPDGKLFTQFIFRTVYRSGIKNLRWETKIDVFPLSLASIVASTDLHELHFSLTQGNWQYKNWGLPSKPSPPGAQIRVRFSKHNEDPDKSWSRLINLLSGQFCSSLVSANSQTLSKPSITFGEAPTSHNSTRYLHYANLPEESLCTENLTPWKKLLPCYSNSGLASLLNAVKVLKSSYLSLAIDINQLNSDQNFGASVDQVSLTQTLTIVLNPLLLFEGKQAWSLTKIFGKPIQGVCSRSDHTLVHVDITKLDDINNLYPKAYDVTSHEVGNGESLEETKYAVFNIKKMIDQNMTSLNLGIKQSQLFRQPPPAKKTKYPLQFETHIAGTGMSEGTMVATISNNLMTDTQIDYMQQIPFILRVYLHTMKIETGAGLKLEPSRSNYIPSTKSLPALVELTLVVPANSVTRITYDFDRVFLRWTEFKPDANRGVLLGSGAIKLSTNISTQHLILHDEPGKTFIYSKPLLVVLPTPDFSMPYNVICLVCTVLVIGFGPLHAIATRKIILKEETKIYST